MNINAIDELNRVLGEIDKKIKHLENSPNRAFVLIEYETVDLFHWFNLCFKQFWNEFDRHSASQLLQYTKITNTYSDLSNRYVDLFREQLDYLENVIDFDNECVKDLPPVVLSEDNGTDVIGYYKECFKNDTDEEGNLLYEIVLDNDTHFEVVNGQTKPIDFYMFRSNIINKKHYKGLLGIYCCLDGIFSLMCTVCSYLDEILYNYKPSQEDIINALDTELRHYAKEIGRNIESDLRRTAQYLKPSRHAQLTPDIWGKVMEKEDDLFDLAISNRLGENEEKRLEHISATKEQLIDNYSLLQKIKDTCFDEELFDIRQSVKTHHLLSSLNADNLDLFYELVLRRNIIHREMFPEKLKDVYEEWANPSKEQNPDDRDVISHDFPLPDELATEKAIFYWERLKQQNFVNEHYMLLETTTRQQAMYIAEPFAEKLGLRNKWKPFEDYWHINNLAQEKWSFQQTGNMPNRYQDIDQIFLD